MEDTNLVDRFAEVPYTGAIADILFEGGFRDQTLPPGIAALQPGQTVAGRAMTVAGEPTTSEDPEVVFIPFLTMLGDLAPGDVIVSQPNDEVCAHFGELSAETSKFRGARGAVIDGGVRDVEYVLRLGFPVFAKYTTPKDINGSWRMVGHRVPITIGSVIIQPGDYIVGDRDGVVVIPKDVAEDVVAKAEEVIRTEDLVRKAILDGTHPVEAFRRFGRF